LIHDSARLFEPVTTPDDLFVLYLEVTVDTALVDWIEAAGGRRVPARNPWWDRNGVTIEVPDDYRLVLCEGAWPVIS
jgi:hypothetical protein